MSEPMRPFKSVTYQAPSDGPRLIVLGAVHGNEVCGTKAIGRLIEALDGGAIRLERGTLTLVAVTNPLAYANERRSGDRNLNRRLAPTDNPREFEDHVANWLCPLLARHEVLLDLHSFQSAGTPFVMVGPEDNDGAIEPFAYAAEEVALAQRLGVSRAVDGWLSTYALGVDRRRISASGGGAAASVDLDPRYGIGTTEYMRSVGGWGLTLECGQHEDAAAPQVAFEAILNTLGFLNLILQPPASVPMKMEGLRLCEVVDKIDTGDAFARPWKSFDRFSDGELIATRSTGEALCASFDGWIVFPNSSSPAGQEWYYLAQNNSRFD